MELFKGKGWKFVLAIAVTLLALNLVMAAYILIVPDGSYGDAFSLGQLFLESMLLPVAALGFWMAYQEFRKSQRRPSLYLAWDDEVLTYNKELVLHLERPNLGSKKTPDRLNHPVALHNDGDNVATWYSIHMEFPVELLGRKNIPHFWSADLLRLLGFYEEIGERENWIRKQAPSTQDEIFQSNGTLASFPKQKITLGRFSFLPIPEGEGSVQQYDIRYKIYTDVGPSRIDYLKLKVIWTD